MQLRQSVVNFAVLDMPFRPSEPAQQHVLYACPYCEAKTSTSRPVQDMPPTYLLCPRCLTGVMIRDSE